MTPSNLRRKTTHATLQSITTSSTNKNVNSSIHVVEPQIQSSPSRRKNDLATIPSKTIIEDSPSIPTHVKTLPQTEANISRIQIEQEEEHEQNSGSDQSEDYSSTNSQLDTETMDAILSTTVEKASSGTKALYELSKHLVTVTDDIMDYAKRKFDDSEEIVPVSLRECLERASKRTRQEACNCEEATVATLKEGLAFLKELRMMNEVSNEYLRLRTISQIVLLRSMTVMERNHLTPTAITNNKPAPSVSSTYSDTS